MTDIDRLRNDLIDAKARVLVAPTVAAFEARDRAARALAEALKDSNTDVTPDRPEICREFEISIDGERWRRWIAAKSGGVVTPDDRSIWWSWEDFDRCVANGTWEWRYPQKDENPQRTGWFTAYTRPRTERDVRVRRELREDGIVYDESGYQVKYGLNGYTDIQWEDDEPSVRQDDVEIAVDFGEDGTTYIHPLQGVWTPIYRFDNSGKIRETIRIRVEGVAPVRQYTEEQIRRALYSQGMFGEEIDSTIDVLGRNT
jgi:hypothetical protein